MPKERGLNSSSLDRAMASPYSRCSKSADPSNTGTQPSDVGDEKEWEEARCPICMDHPHNAVLLKCSSRHSGCRPFVCDTSYRHSNCLDQLLRSHGARPLVCPLCRGLVTRWDVVGPARQLMNSKTRSCSLETCEFSGMYSELRKHARAEHPLGRPSEASPAQRADWSELEQRMDLEDVLAYQSDMDFEPELWDEWGSDGLFDLPGGLSDLEDRLVDEIFGSGISLSFLSLSHSNEEDVVDSGSSVFGLDGWDRDDVQSLRLEMWSSFFDVDPGEDGTVNVRSRSSSRRENVTGDVQSRSGNRRGSRSGGSSSRASYGRQNENMTSLGSGSGYRRQNENMTSLGSGSGYRVGNGSESRSRSSYHGEHRQLQPSSRGNGLPLRPRRSRSRRLSGSSMQSRSGYVRRGE